MGALGRAVERWLAAERDQLPLWLPVMVGLGIAAWFLLPDTPRWGAFILATLSLALMAIATSRGGRLTRAVAIAGFAAAIGCAMIWWRAERVTAPVLAHPGVARFTGKVIAMEPLPARKLVRLRVAVSEPQAMPPVIRVNLAEKDVPEALSRGALVRMRAWLMPPPPAALPGAYDFARVAWFQGIGATGRGFAPVEVIESGDAPSADLRHRLAAHIRSRLAGDAGAVAATLATGDRGAIGDDDAEAMRRSGLAHLLSISGLHVTAVVGATMILVLRLLALIPGLALRVRLPLVAAAAGALAAVGYTWLTGAQVPTIRSCIAALLVLAALALGREAITLRLVAAGALVVLIALPESLAGPSFQLSFAAVTAIVALHEHRAVQRWFARREERWPARLARGLLSLLLTGMVVEFALMPIALYHFHKAGLYGAAANIVAIPLTTFVIMPAEALALLFDTVGLGAPFWWITGEALHLLLALAHATAGAPGAVAAMPVMPSGAFAAMVGGGLWVALWRTRWRWLGVAPVAVGALWAALTPAPDMLVSADGSHLAVRTANDEMALLRERSGDYIRDAFAATAGFEGDLTPISDLPDARCSKDVCTFRQKSGERSWTILATGSDYLVPRKALQPACAASDIVVSDRRLPRWCRPRWLMLDRRTLAATGGVAISLIDKSLRTTRLGSGDHPWANPPTVMPPRPSKRTQANP
ncbi:ComEC/Rec2 family competence protein [Stakelama sp. CBK3Z-3]|uniref:ComEC/Rec2 family competence protein n=2 Tax=Stakelama flava TaxID=2860338 RepID=A0ABS6XGG6_9SPHN|nr:ComEC/Rec2 family competence protein [Stakelama flava]